MRILYLTLGYTPHDRRFLAAMVEAGHEALYAPLTREVTLAEGRALPGGVRALELPPGLSLHKLAQQVRALREVVSVFRPDVVHAGPVQSVAWRAVLAGLHPLVTMSWGSDLMWGARGGLGRVVARYVLARSDVLICDCRAVRDRAVSLGMRAEKIVVFPWGVDLEHFRPGPASPLRSSLGWQEAFVILSTRSWEPIYGIEALLSGFLGAARADRSLRLLMLGDGSLRAKVESMIRHAGLGDRVHLAGTVGQSALPDVYRSADLYVSASRSDGSSVSLLEAMACGLPALVSDIPGNREWVDPGRNGWWFREGAPQDLARGLVEARAAPLRKMGDAARSVVAARANWAVGKAELERAYRLARDQGGRLQGGAARPRPAGGGGGEGKLSGDVHDGTG